MAHEINCLKVFAMFRIRFFGDLPFLIAFLIFSAIIGHIFRQGDLVGLILEGMIEENTIEDYNYNTNTKL